LATPAVDALADDALARGESIPECDISHSKTRSYRQHKISKIYLLNIVVIF